MSLETQSPQSLMCEEGPGGRAGWQYCTQSTEASLVFGCSGVAHGLAVISQARMSLPVSKAGCGTHAKAILFCIAKGLWQAYTVAGNSQGRKRKKKLGQSQAQRRP